MEYQEEPSDDGAGFASSRKAGRLARASSLGVSMEIMNASIILLRILPTSAVTTKTITPMKRLHRSSKNVPSEKATTLTVIVSHTGDPSLPSS
jgi:hypothetical protein